MAELGLGETEAITLALEFHADLLLMDDRRGVNAALEKGLTVTGTVGLLARAARNGILDLADAFTGSSEPTFVTGNKSWTSYFKKRELCRTSWGPAPLPAQARRKGNAVF